MGIQNPILKFTSNHSLTTNVQFPCLWTDLNFFLSLTWKFAGDSKSDIVLYLKWLTGPQKFLIMICCKINFDIIWYSVIFAANQYLSIFVWSSHILNFVFMNVVILVNISFRTIRQKKKNLLYNLEYRKNIHIRHPLCI